MRLVNLLGEDVARSANAKRRWTNDERIEAQKLLIDGWPVKTLCRKLHASPKTIRALRRSLAIAPRCRCGRDSLHQGCCIERRTQLGIGLHKPKE